MRLPWNKPKEVQLDLLDAEPGLTASHPPAGPVPRTAAVQRASTAIPPATPKVDSKDGRLTKGRAEPTKG